MASVVAASVMHVVSHVEHKLLHTRFAVVLAQNKSLPAGAKPASPAVGCFKPSNCSHTSTAEFGGACSSNHRNNKQRAK